MRSKHTTGNQFGSAFIKQYVVIKKIKWKIILNAIFTKHKFHLMNFSNGLCHFCKTEIEDIKIFFYTCGISHEIIKKIKRKKKIKIKLTLF